MKGRIIEYGLAKAVWLGLPLKRWLRLLGSARLRGRCAGHPLTSLGHFLPSAPPSRLCRRGRQARHRPRFRDSGGDCGARWLRPGG